MAVESEITEINGGVFKVLIKLFHIQLDWMKIKKYCLKFITSINMIKQSMKIYQFFISFISASILLLELSTYHIQPLNHSRLCFLFLADYIKTKEYSWIENKHHKLNKILHIDYNTWEEDLILDHLVFVPGQIYFTHIMVHMYHMI